MKKYHVETPNQGITNPPVRPQDAGKAEAYRNPLHAQNFDRGSKGFVNSAPWGKQPRTLTPPVASESGG